MPASPPISQATLGKSLASAPRFSHLQNEDKNAPHFVLP